MTSLLSIVPFAAMIVLGKPLLHFLPTGRNNVFFHDPSLLQKEIIRQQEQILLFTGIVIFLLILFLGFIVWSYYILREKNQRILVQNQELEKQYLEIETSNKDLERLVSRLEGMSKEKGELVEFLANSIIEPLHQTTGLVHFIENAGKLNKDQANFLRKIETILHKQKKTLKDLIDYDFSGQSDARINLEIISFSDFVEMIQQKFISETEQLHFNLPSTLDFKTQTDVKMLSFLVENLIRNALRANQNNHQKVSISVSVGASTYQIVVKDFGQRIPQTDVAGLFINYRRQELEDHPFNQLYKKLPLIKAILDLLNCIIEINTDQQTIGNEFRVTLPLSYSSNQSRNGQSDGTKDPALDTQFELISKKILEEEMFTDPEITIQKVADEVSMSLHEVSFVVNKKSGMNFQNFINSLRVEKAIDLLSDPQFQHLSLLGIGYEAGFNAKSTFYAAFKKQTGLTPREFQKKKLEESS